MNFVSPKPEGPILSLGSIEPTAQTFNDSLIG